VCFETKVAFLRFLFEESTSLFFMTLGEYIACKFVRNKTRCPKENDVVSNVVYSGVAQYCRGSLQDNGQFMVNISAYFIPSL